MTKVEATQTLRIRLAIAGMTFSWILAALFLTDMLFPRTRLRVDGATLTIEKALSTRRIARAEIAKIEAAIAHTRGATGGQHTVHYAVRIWTSAGKRYTAARHLREKRDAEAIAGLLSNS